MDETTRAAAALAAGTISLVAGQPAQAATGALPAVQNESFTLTLTPGLGNIKFEKYDTFENVAFIYAAQSPFQKVGSAFLKLESPYIKFEDKWSPSDTMSFVGPGDASTPKEFMVLGEYADAAGAIGGVFVGMGIKEADGAIKLDSSFDSALKLSKLTGLSELKIESALLKDDKATLDLLFKDSFALNNGAALTLDQSTKGYLVDFSGAHFGGTFNVTQAPVPEPSKVWTMLTGLLALCGIRWARARQVTAPRS